MAAYVIKSWTRTYQPSDPQATHVRIVGRAAGLGSWLLSLVGIDPTISLTVTTDHISFEEGSLNGKNKQLTPLEHACTTFYGYSKPLKEAVMLGIVVGGLTIILLGIPGILLGVLYYFLNKTLTIGFTDLGGGRNVINFKRSVIEGQSIDESAAAEVCVLIQELMDSKRQNSRLLPAAA